MAHFNLLSVLHSGCALNGLLHFKWFAKDHRSLIWIDRGTNDRSLWCRSRSLCLLGYVYHSLIRSSIKVHWNIERLLAMWCVPSIIVYVDQELVLDFGFVFYPILD